MQILIFVKPVFYFPIHVWYRKPSSFSIRMYSYIDQPFQNCLWLRINLKIVVRNYVPLPLISNFILLLLQFDILLIQNVILLLQVHIEDLGQASNIFVLWPVQNLVEQIQLLFLLLPTKSNLKYVCMWHHTNNFGMFLNSSLWRIFRL